MKYNLGLFTRIVIVGIVASLVHLFILTEISVNYGLAFFFVMLIDILAIGIGIIIFIYIQKTGLAKFINKKNVNIFCIILAVTIILPAIIQYYIAADKVPPAEIPAYWICDRGQELCNKLDAMHLVYDGTYLFTQGDFFKNGSNVGIFIWRYDRISKEITFYERTPKPDGWNLKLRLEITGDKYHRKMNTYYISSSGKLDLETTASVSNATGDYNIVTKFPSFDNEQFNGVTWTAS